MCNIFWNIVKFYFIWIGLFIFRHIVWCDCWCANVRNSIRHATPIMPLIMTQIHSQEMSEVFQISYFDMESTFKSFVHVIFCLLFLSFARAVVWFFEIVRFSWQMCQRRFHCFGCISTLCALRYQKRFDRQSWLVSIRFTWYHATMCYLTLVHRPLLSNKYTHCMCPRGCGPLSQFMSCLSWPINSKNTSTISNEKQTDNNTISTAATTTKHQRPFQQNCQKHNLYILYRGCLSHQKWNN